MPSPAETLVRWLAARMAPLDISAKHLMHPQGVSYRPWYVPALRGGAVDEDGCTARQIALGGLGMEPDYALVYRLKGMYFSSLNSHVPMRWCLASSSSTARGHWSAARVYTVPYESSIEAHVVAIQIAVAMQDLVGAGEVRQGNTFLARTPTEAYGVLEGRPLGRLKPGVSIEGADIDSILQSARAVSHETIRAPVMAMRRAYDEIRDQLEEPDLVRDVISILGLLTARSEWYDGSQREEFTNHQQDDKLMELVQNHWRKPPNPTGPKRFRYETPDQIRARWRYLLNVLREARAVLDDPDLSDVGKMGTLHGILVPTVWGQSTFEKRISARNISEIVLNADMQERIRTAIDASAVGIQTRLKRRFPDG